MMEPVSPVRRGCALWLTKRVAAPAAVVSVAISSGAIAEPHINVTQGQPLAGCGALRTIQHGRRERHCQ